MKKQFLFSLLLITIILPASAQDLLSQLQASEPKEKEYIIQTFKGTRVVNGMSVETKGKGELEFIISHRFGKLNSGAYEFFGLDNASIRLGLEYGLTDNLGIGLGRSKNNKIYDGYLKYKAIRQAKGGSPVTVTLVGSAGLVTIDTAFSTPKLTFQQKIYYSSHALIARKFSPKFSMQVSQAILHANLVSTGEVNTLAAVGVGARYKLNGSISLNSEYFHRFNAPDETYKNCIGFGLDIETGGHVFQLILSNTDGMVDRTYLGNTDGNFFNGDINFGFNITRTFQIKSEKKLKEQ